MMKCYNIKCDEYNKHEYNNCEMHFNLFDCSCFAKHKMGKVCECLQDDGFFRYFKYLKDDTCLAPCPFCGFHGDFGTTKTGQYVVMCFNCQAESGHRMTKDEARKAWNKRR